MLLASHEKLKASQERLAHLSVGRSIMGSDANFVLVSVFDRQTGVADNMHVKVYKTLIALRESFFPVRFLLQ